MILREPRYDRTRRTHTILEKKKQENLLGVCKIVSSWWKGFGPGFRRLTILDKIKIDFNYIGYGKPTCGVNEHDTSEDYNNFEVAISYNGKTEKISYSFEAVNLKGIMSDVLENMFNIDIIGRIIIDCYPFKTIEELKSCLRDKGFEETEEYYQQLYNDIHAQSRKFRRLFTENDLSELKIELQDWLDTHPEEAKRFGKLEIQN